jgi:hypothetical protein
MRGIDPNRLGDKLQRRNKETRPSFARVRMCDIC